MSEDKSNKTSESVTIRAHFSMSLRSYFSIEFIRSAALFAKSAYDIERKIKKPFNQERRNSHRSFVLGSIIFSISFLEALVNELATDYSERRYSHFPEMKSGKDELIGKSWHAKTYPKSILKKYQHTLILANKSPFDKQINPYQNIVLLVKLRNALVHFKPESIELLNTNPDEEINTHKFESSLKGKFQESEFYVGTGNAFWPEKCLGYGCTDWSVRSSITFANLFLEKLGIGSSLQKQWDVLETK